MPSQEEFDELKGRIVELENALKQRRQDEPDITPEEMETYKKVRDRLGGDWDDPRNRIGGVLCAPTPVIRCFTQCFTQCFFCSRCIFECTCGPCLQFGPDPGGFGRFGGLGG
jgi:hypothetical protein